MPKYKVEAVLELLETEKAYIAGLLDGEGCFSALDRVFTLKNGKQKPCTQFAIYIGMTDKDIMEWLVSKVPQFRLRKSFYKTSKKICKPIWTAYTNRYVHVLIIIKAILPYLKVKREKAKRILDQLEKISWITLVR